MIHFETLDIWKLSIELTQEIYTIVGGFPKTEIYSLVDQMKRASTSVGANIAEGDGRGSNADNIRFLYMARGSLYELYAHIRVAEKIGFITSDASEKVRNSIEVLLKKISAYISYKQK